MGGDGGVIAAKREFMQSCGDVFGMKGGMVKTSLNRTETAELRTKVCAISNERLQEPVAACELGYLYNKDTLISSLLDHSLNEAFSHIRGLKDTVDCKFTPNPAAEKDDRPPDGPEPSRFMCPVTLQELNGSHSFVVLKSTGWVLSEKAIKEVGIAGLQGEYGPFGESDIIHLAPTDEERGKRRKTLLANREAARQAKAARKLAKKSARRDQSSAIADAPSAAAQESSREPDTNASSHGVGGGDGKADAMAEVSSERKKGKRRKREESEKAAASTSVSSGPESSRVAGAAAQAVEKSKQDSAVYASLFGKKKVSNEHLFIATAGHRYNLG